MNKHFFVATTFLMLMITREMCGEKFLGYLSNESRRSLWPLSMIYFFRHNLEKILFSLIPAFILLRRQQKCKELRR